MYRLLLKLAVALHNGLSVARNAVYKAISYAFRGANVAASNKITKAEQSAVTMREAATSMLNRADSVVVEAKAKAKTLRNRIADDYAKLRF